MQADSNKEIVRISDYCDGDELPKTYKFNADVKKMQDGIVLGFMTYAIPDSSENFCLGGLPLLRFAFSIVVSPFFLFRR